MSRAISGAELSALKGTLQARFEELRDAIRQELLRSDDERYVELAGQVHDLEDASLADLLVDVGLAEIDRHLIELQQVEAALERMAEGYYGQCVECGGSIELQRLRVQPAAARCRPCQERYEKLHPGVVAKL